MEATFEELKKGGKNNVESLVQWLKDSKLLGDQEDTVRKLFDDAADKSNVDFAKFKDVLGKLATDQKKTLEDLIGSLASCAPTLLENLKAGAAAAVASVAETAKEAASNALSSEKKE